MNDDIQINACVSKRRAGCLTGSRPAVSSTGNPNTAVVSLMLVSTADVHKNGSMVLLDKVTACERSVCAEMTVAQCRALVGDLLLSVSMIEDRS